jgi:hypothetical protein
MLELGCDCGGSKPLFANHDMNACATCTLSVSEFARLCDVTRETSDCDNVLTQHCVIHHVLRRRDITHRK